MYEYSSDETQLFEKVEKKISQNARKLIHSLNDNWRLLGVDDPTRKQRTSDLVEFVQERYDEVLEETLGKIKVIKLEIENLKNEAVVLGDRLSMRIDTPFIKKDTPLSIIKETLENDLERYRKLIATREEHLSQLITWQSKLVHRLGCPARELSLSPLPSEEALQDLVHYLKGQEEEYEKRVQVFLKKQEDIMNLLHEIEDDPQDSFQYYVTKTSYKDFRVTDQNMAKLDVVNENLLHQFQQKEAKVLEMRERLSVLWERLEESPEYRMTFLAKYPGHSRTTQTALEAELQRCEEKKRQSFKLFVSKVRSEIVEMWDSCLYSDLQREKFVEFYSNIYNEDLLMLHEIYLEELKVFHKENKDIFDMYGVRQQLWTKWSELEARAHEPGRFHNRGGQLLREEKERKAVSNQLPKIEAELTQLVELYESRTGKKFTVNGESLLMSMQHDWNVKQLERKNKLSSRKLPPSMAGSMSAPRTAPQTRQVINFSSRAAMTAVKRRLSPRQSPQVSKSRLLPRRLLLSPGAACATPNLKSVSPTPETGPLLKKFKGPLPGLAINGCIIKKKKVVGRRSGDSKNRRRSRRSRGEVSGAGKSSRPEQDKGVPDNTLSSYIDFQVKRLSDEHLHDNSASRSSIVPKHNLRSRTFTPQASSSVYLPDGQITPNKNAIAVHTIRKRGASKENAPPFTTPNKLTIKAQTYASNTFGATPTSNRLNPSHNSANKVRDAKSARNVELFATPRPVSKAAKSGLLYRQNTVALASPIERTRPMLRSSSSHNLRANSPSFTHAGTKLQLASKLPLII